ncbi:hypothetical protein GIB67_026915 [Kingdonia uniflora]|uniref:RIN4 pathogenic type III effector avirulence factor Avr cleavage site domain-containing protein n=1 Tax=Kingdonia uniflora TaxID=39325 RepID=A0A7J7P1L6_9MAGN|nr:hypothetical protein GIB67_026915 [Kingdonia uniflora]
MSRNNEKLYPRRLPDDITVCKLGTQTMSSSLLHAVSTSAHDIHLQNVYVQLWTIKTSITQDSLLQSSVDTKEFQPNQASICNNVEGSLNNPYSVISRDADVTHRAASVPKFGAWDETDPRSGEGFTVIFNKVKEEKQIGTSKFPTIPPPPPTSSNERKSNRNSSPESKVSSFSIDTSTSQLFTMIYLASR